MMIITMIKIIILFYLLLFFIYFHVVALYRPIKKETTGDGIDHYFIFVHHIRSYCKIPGRPWETNE